MIRTRKAVPEYYEKSRDFQVFLKLLDLIINACKADIDYFTSLLSADQCKASMLTLLANYVGYDYDYAQRVSVNRAIIKNWPTLIRNRGNETGIRMAVALSINQSDDLDSVNVFQLFNVDFVNSVDKYARPHTQINIYLFHDGYIDKLYDLIEAVRPVGTDIKVIPSISIQSSETIVLTDEYRMLGYDYTTGKLLKIGAVEILVENCWEIIKDGESTSEFLVDGEFYDEFHNKTGYSLDSNQRIIDMSGTLTGEYIAGYKIYKDENGEKQYTGKHFNLDHCARVLNTCYEIRTGGKGSGYFISADNWNIIDSLQGRVQFYLKDYKLSGKLVKKVYSIEEDIKYNWHIDLDTRFFVNDDDGDTLDTATNTVPWDEHHYITKKRYVMNKTAAGALFLTDYFVNQFEDIEDSAGNVILSKQDRYKVSDSSAVGFSEVHNTDDSTDHTHSWMYARQYTYFDDKDFYRNEQESIDYNDYTTSEDYTDERIKIRLSDIHISNVSRQYDSTNNIGRMDLSNAIIDGNSATMLMEGTESDNFIAGSWTLTPVIKGITARLHVDFNIKDSLISKYELLINNKVVATWTPSDKGVVIPPVLFNNPESAIIYGYTKDTFNEEVLICAGILKPLTLENDIISGRIEIYGYSGFVTMSIGVKLKSNHSLFDVFETIDLQYDDEDVSTGKNIIMHWKIAPDANKYYDTSMLPAKIVFSQAGTITKRLIRFDGSPLILNSKVYDGSTKLTNPTILNPTAGGDM